MSNHPNVGGGRDLLFLMAYCDTANNRLPNHG